MLYFYISTTATTDHVIMFGQISQAKLGVTMKIMETVEPNKYHQ